MSIALCITFPVQKLLGQLLHPFREGGGCCPGAPATTLRTTTPRRGTAAGAA
eukprot:gene37229-6820_t